MSHPRLYVPRPLTAGMIITVEGQPAHHVVHVLRMRIGDALRVFDGAGHEHHATLADTGRGKIVLELGAAMTRDTESSLQLVLVQGIARHDRMDLILQKAVELGVHTIQPLWLQRSQTRLSGERLAKRLRHWQGIIISACEQCGRSFLPALYAPAEFKEWLDAADVPATRLMLQPDSMATLGSLESPSGDIVLLVGPEGGLTADEQSLAVSSGFLGVRLGPRILRTETAALAAIAGLQALWGDFC